MRSRKEKTLFKEKSRGAGKKKHFLRIIHANKIVYILYLRFFYLTPDPSPKERGAGQRKVGYSPLSFGEGSGGEVKKGSI
jgi:hypothetical protein